MLVSRGYILPERTPIADCGCNKGLSGALDVIEEYKRKVDASLEAIPRITEYAETIQWWIPFIVAGLGFVGMAILINAKRT